MTATDKYAGEQAALRVRRLSYREQALKLFPWICGRCAREFDGKTVRGLTVHHRDHNHDNNPPDGSNWELLCLYCHEAEHDKYERAGSTSTILAEPVSAPGRHNPFSGLDQLLGGDAKAPKKR